MKTLTEDECYEIWRAVDDLIETIRLIYKTGYDDGQTDMLTEQLKQPESKWYDNIPKHGVLCWCEEYKDDIKYKRLIERIDEYTEGRFLSHTTGFLYKTVIPLTNEEIEEFKR